MRFSSAVFSVRKTGLMKEFFQAQLDYIFFLYGLSFIILSVICFHLGRLKKDNLPWPLFGVFAFAHGIIKWLYLVAFDFVDNRVLSFRQIDASCNLLCDPS